LRTIPGAPGSVNRIAAGAGRGYEPRKDTTRAVIFDVGNVLIRWDPRLLYRQLLEDEAAIDAFFAEVAFDDWNLGFDRGVPWADGVADLAGRFPHRGELARAFHERWQETVPGVVDGMPELLAALAAAGVPLYAITNFSGDKWAETVERFPFLASSFRDVVVSGHERLTKPAPEIFLRCLGRIGLEAGRTVFVDDSAANVAAAAALGIDAIRFTTREALAEALAERGLLSREGSA
jgi:2-haloacid dehalogenase